MELLIVLALSVYGWARYGANGVMAARKKVEPLRVAERRQRANHAHQRHMARMKRRGGKPTIVEAISIRIAHRIANPPKRRHPAREAMFEAWADSWDYATDRRRRRHERAAAGELGRQKAARAARRWLGEKWASGKAKRDAKREAKRDNGTATETGTTQPGAGRQDQVPYDVPDVVDAEIVDDPPADAGTEPAQDDIVDAEIVDDPPATAETDTASDDDPFAFAREQADRLDEEDETADLQAFTVRIHRSNGETHDEVIQAKADWQARRKAELEWIERRERDQADRVELRGAGGGPRWFRVRVHWPDGSSHVDGIRGETKSAALDNARWNWNIANPHGKAEHIEVIGEGEGPWDGPEDDHEFKRQPPEPPTCSFYTDLSRTTECPNTPNVHIRYKRDPHEWKYPPEERTPRTDDVCEHHYQEFFEGNSLAQADIESVQRRTSGTTPGEHHPHNADGHLASVTPIRKELEMSSPSQHNVTSGETLDPAAGRAFVSGVGDVASRLVTEIEQSIATLSQRGVSGEPIALLSQMQESAQTLASHATSAAGHFERHINTQDTVTSDDSLVGTVNGTYLGSRN